MTDTTEKCYCNRPVKADGLCGIHLGAKKRREANQAKQELKYAEGQRIAEQRRADSQPIRDALDAAGVNYSIGGESPYAVNYAHTLTIDAGQWPALLEAIGGKA